MLKPDQIKAIEKEAEEKYPVYTNEDIGLPEAVRKVNVAYTIGREAYIAGKTSGLEEAEEIAIAFTEWKEIVDHQKNIPGVLYPIIDYKKTYTTKELFSLFINQYLKK